MHYDAEGVRTGHTVITREPLWNDDDRERALALDVYERSMCPCGCGLPIAEAHDPSRAFDVKTATCRASKAIAKIRREAEDKAKARNGGELPPDWADGVIWYVGDSFVPKKKTSG